MSVGSLALALARGQGAEGKRLLGVEQGLADVQGRGGRSGDGPSQRSGQHVR